MPEQGGRNQVSFLVAATGFLFYDRYGCDLSNTTPNFTPKALAPQSWGAFPLDISYKLSKLLLCIAYKLFGAVFSYLAITQSFYTAKQSFRCGIRQMHHLCLNFSPTVDAFWRKNSEERYKSERFLSRQIQSWKGFFESGDTK